MKTVSALALLFCFAATTWPQASTTAVRGSVTDQTGAVVPNASVTLVNTATNVSLHGSTNDLGAYVFPGIVPGPYRLSVEADGMQKFEATLQTQVQQTAVVDVVLKVGQTTTEISVADVTPLMTVDNPTLGHVLERRRIEQLPINGRFITTLLQTTPGLELVNTIASTVSVRPYGLRHGSAEFVLDGASLNQRMHGGTAQRPPGLDTVQEFKVETNNSSAKFARPTTIVMSTRSGTNMLHGSVFETHRNNGLGKARARTDYYDKAPQLIRNEFGAAAGGPVYVPKLYNGKDRTFWFLAYEGYRNIAPVTRGWTVPTEAMRNGDFRGLVDAQGRAYKIYDPWSTDPVTWQRQQVSYGGQLNVIDPARMSPLAKYLFSVTPLPTFPQVNPLEETNWFGPGPNTARQYTITARIDHRFSDKDQVYGRYTKGDLFHHRIGLPAVTAFAALDGVSNTVTDKEKPQSLAVSWVRTISPTFFNELLASASRIGWRTQCGDDVKYANQLGLPNPMDSIGWPTLSDTGLTAYSFGGTNRRAGFLNYYIIDNNSTKIYRNHEFEFGVHYRYDQMNTLPAQQQVQGSHSWATGATSLYDPSTSRTNPLATPFTGHNLANMYLGVMNYSNQFVRGYFYLRNRELALYFQDKYKITPRLTLNLGLRWEYWPAMREKNGVMTSFDPDQRAIVLGQDLETMYRLGATLPSIVERFQSMGAKFLTYKEAGYPQALMDSNLANLGPRFGFAYRVGDGAKAFILRGGYRISYFHIPTEVWTARMRSNAPLTARFRTSVTDAAYTPDGIPNYGMRSVPTMIAGVNSSNAVQLTDASTLTRGSAGASYFARDQPDPRVQDWNLTLEKELKSDFLLRASYVGNHGEHLEQFYRYNDSPNDYIWFVTTGQRKPTGEYANVATRNYDQTVYGSIEEYRKTGWSNYHGVQLEFEKRYNQGYAFHLYYSMGNVLAAGGNDWNATYAVPELNQFLPGAVPADYDERNRLYNYRRDQGVPKHRLSWNWIVDLPFGKGKPFGSGTGGVLDKVIGGWQLAGLGSLRTNYFELPTSVYPTGENIDLYGYQYKIQDCRSGRCIPGYLWWNGYIPANQINSVDANGKPNGVMGVPANYRPAGAPLIPWPEQPNRNDPMYPYYGTNTVWVPLKDGTMQRTTYDDNLHPWRQQFFPGVRQWGLDASLFKSIPITERITLRFNADFFNVLNHPGNPNAIGSDGILRVEESGQSARELQLTLRLSW